MAPHEAHGCNDDQKWREAVREGYSANPKHGGAHRETTALPTSDNVAGYLKAGRISYASNRGLEREAPALGVSSAVSSKSVQATLF